MKEINSRNIRKESRKEEREVEKREKGGAIRIRRM
jgi:hypothetical protein